MFERGRFPNGKFCYLKNIQPKFHLFKRLPQIDIILDHFERKVTIKLRRSCFRNAKMRHNLGTTLFGDKHAVLQPCFSAALITLPEHGVLMIRGTAECLIGPQPNDASVSHLEVCAEEITASIFWYAHACHHGLSLVSAILCLTLAEKQSRRQFAIRAHPPQGRTPQEEAV